MNAIVALTRGYQNKFEYSWLIERNRSLPLDWPVVLFHEGNIPKEHQDYIIRESHKEIKFVDVSEVFLPKSVHNAGYISMCRFYTYYIWEYCKEYEWIMRIDEDCIIQSMEFPKIGNEIYFRSMAFAESHSETNATLPGFIEEITKEKGFYNHKFPYTNVSMAKVKFFRSTPVNEILKKIALSDMQVQNRWGDLPVIGCILNIYAPQAVGKLICSYYHASHDMTVKCNGID